jgi:ABC-type multidrug transport system fused ATPase/permease subunit
VWHLADGRIVEVGAPADLLAADGPTARLFAAEHPVR